jgi:hypothetical protein
MQAWLDLWSYDDVRDHAWDALERVEAGEMPCDEPWEEQKVQTLGTWISMGIHPDRNRSDGDSPRHDRVGTEVVHDDRWP